jgi:hypothetical protein
VVTHVPVTSVMSTQELPRVYSATTAATHVPLVVRTHVLLATLERIELWRVVTHVLVTSAM